MTVLIISLAFIIFIFLYEKEFKAKYAAEKRLLNLKSTRPRNPLRNISRIRTCYLKLDDNLSAQRRESFMDELERRLDMLEQMTGNRPLNIQEADVVYDKVRRGR